MLRLHLHLHPLYHSHTNILYKKLPFSSKLLLSIIMPINNSNSLLSTKLPFLPSFSTFNGFQTPHRRLIMSTNNNSANSHPLTLQTSPLSYSAHSTIPPPVSLDGSSRHTERLRKLMMKLKELRIEGYDPMPGQYNRLSCPMVAIILTYLLFHHSPCFERDNMFRPFVSFPLVRVFVLVKPNYSYSCVFVLVPLQCRGGDSGERSLALNISADGNNAVWICFRGKCGWQGNTMAIDDALPTYGRSKQIIKATKRVLTKDSLSLEPLCKEVTLFPWLLIDTRSCCKSKLMCFSLFCGESRSPELLTYFAERMITASTLRRNYVMQKNNGNKVALAFPYMRQGALVGCKYRDENKKFWQEEDTEKIFYGLDDIRNATDIIIVEGEVDKLSLEEAGYLNCVSVPDGAPPKVSEKDLPSPDEASRIILATDGDQPGQALAEELARRLGRERCWRVKWPKKNEADYFKDANEVLTYLGRERLKEAIESAELYPIQGLFNFRDYFPEIDAYYHRVLGDELGLSTGWRCLDEYYNVVPGELTIVTGIPNSGKSEWIDALLCNLNESVGWKFALCSMENKVREHARKLMEKHMKKPFFNVRYGESVERMTVEELEQGKEWLDKTFHLIRYAVFIYRLADTQAFKNIGMESLHDSCQSCSSHAWCTKKNLHDKGRARFSCFGNVRVVPLERILTIQQQQHYINALRDPANSMCENDSLPSIKWVLELAKSAVLRHGVRGLVIDPYNELDHQRNKSMTETEYVSQMLTMVKRFAQHYSCHVWFVAHPKQLQNWSGNAPNLYDISGSAHFINKCDNGIVVHRNRDPEAGPIDRVQAMTSACVPCRFFHPYSSNSLLTVFLPSDMCKEGTE
ncbi:hypothetical protein KSS87_012961 [Heliosperma pusillum]|nr:hypothetical protein KSS87_012961 [Heliosperma pusillum]